MKYDHLTDDIIQAFILKETSDGKIALHISECNVCKAKLESYQMLMSAMGDIEPESFSFDITTIVMQRIEQYENKKKAFGFYVLMTILGIIIVGLLVISIPFILPVFQLFPSMTMITNVFIIVSALSVFIFLLTDIFRQYKQKERLFLNKILQP